MTDIDHDRAYEIALDSELEVTTGASHAADVLRENADMLDKIGQSDAATKLRLEAQKLSPGPVWVCTREGCGRTRTTACKPAGCANDLIDRREFKAGVRGLHINDNDFANGWDE